MGETNFEHYFGDKLIADTLTILTWDNHTREECRRFKNKLKTMSPKELQEWLQEERVKNGKVEFNW